MRRFRTFYPAGRSQSPLSCDPTWDRLYSIWTMRPFLSNPLKGDAKPSPSQTSTRI